jgi:hypothetical protein
VIINFNDHIAGFQIYLNLNLTIQRLVVPPFEEVVSLTLKALGPYALLTTSFLPGTLLPRVPITDRSFSLSSKYCLSKYS